MPLRFFTSEIQSTGILVDLKDYHIFSSLPYMFNPLFVIKESIWTICIIQTKINAFFERFYKTVNKTVIIYLYHCLNSTLRCILYFS